jgi:hypothetical protein
MKHNIDIARKVFGKLRWPHEWYSYALPLSDIGDLAVFSREHDAIDT